MPVWKRPLCIWEDLAEFLVHTGYTVSVVNPARTKGFAVSQLKRNKTDKVDSEVIADFCERLAPRSWTPPRPEQRQLRDLVRHIDVLKKSRTQHRNRLSTCRNLLVQQSLQLLVDTIDTQIKAIEAQIEQIFRAYPALKRQRTLLMSIQGIGKRTASKLLAEMYDMEAYENAPAAGTDAGVTPAHDESGPSVRRRSRLSKVGKATVRGALYWPASTAMQYNPVVRDLKERLEKKVHTSESSWALRCASSSIWRMAYSRTRWHSIWRMLVSQKAKILRASINQRNIWQG